MAKEDRSRMNVVFRLGDEDMEKKLVAEATEAGFSGVKGHRSVGGLRASLYNAVSPESVHRLVEVLEAFAKG